MSLAASVKRGLERLLLASGAARLARRRRLDQVLVLAYHNIRPDDALPLGEHSLHLMRSRFAAQLEILAATHDVVPVAEVLERRSGGRPRAAITFDDAYVGALTLGLDEVVARRLPATVFVAPALLGERATWWDRLADPATGEVDPRVRATALERFAGRTRDVLRPGAAGDAELPAWARIADVESVRAAARRPGISMAVHGWSHLNMAAVDPATAVEETTRPIEWMNANGVPFVSWFAYPYGLFTPDVFGPLRAAGYVGAFRVSGGWVHSARDQDRFALPRYNVPAGLSDAGFALRAAGIGPYR